MLATAVPGGPIIIPEEEPGVALQLASAASTNVSPSPSPKPAASPKPQSSPENPFALPDEEEEEQQQQVGALSAPSPSPQPDGGSEAAAAPLPSPPWVEQQEAASEEEDIDTPEEIDRADALGAANDCVDFGWTVLRFEHNKALPLNPGDLASAQLEARKLTKQQR